MLRRRPPGEVRQEVFGGRQQTVVQVGTVERLNLYVQFGAPGLLTVLGSVLLLYRPRLPVPDGWGLSPVWVGWLCLGSALGLWVAARLVRVRRRSEAVWSSARVLDKAADDVAEALLQRYEDDERLRQADDPQTLDVLWRGRGDGPDAHERSIADYFEDAAAVPDRRLVVLGPAGAGKSVLVLRLARDLLRRRAGRATGNGAASPVPVVVSLASWDTGRGLEAWAAGQLAAEHPQACAPVPGAPPERTAAYLVDTGRVLLVLDGFDELPEAARTVAFAELRAMPESRPFVLTSRPEEYGEQVPADSDFLRTEIRLEPLTPQAVGAYLSAGGRRARWRNVVGRLTEAAPDRSPEARLLLQALDVPLMVGLARAAYGPDDEDRHPDELVAPGRFGSVEELRRHLYAAYLDAVYSSSRSWRELHGGSSPDEARMWAGFLAARMRAAGRTEFAWWELDREVPWWVRVLGFVPALAVAGVCLRLAAFGKPWWQPEVVDVPLWGGFAVAAALAGAFTGLATVRGRDQWRLPPHRLTGLSARRMLAALRRRPVRWGVGLTGTGLVAGWATALVQGSVFGAVVGAVSLLAVGAHLHEAVWRPADTALADSPDGLLRADRRAVLAFGFLDMVRSRSPDYPRALLLLPVPMLLWWQSFGHGRHHVSVLDWVVVGGGSLVSWLMYGVAVSAWGRYTVARLWLAAGGRLPRRLMAFLRDAHRRGVLRQTGGFYQFRHIELRDRLAEDVSAHDRRGAHSGDDPGDGSRDGPGDGSRDGPGDGSRDDGGVGHRDRGPGGRGRRPVGGRLGMGLAATVCSMAVLLLGSGVLVMTTALPVQALPGACSLLDERDLGRLMADGVVQPLAEGTRCSVTEQSPFDPEVRIDVRAQWYRTSMRQHGVREAEAWFDLGRMGVGEDVTLHGFGDEAYAVFWQQPSVWDFMDVSPWRAALVARYGNAVISVQYAEEFATRERTAAVAEILFRKALRAAGPQWAEDGAGGDGTLADPPKSRIPEEGQHRFSFYRREARGAVHGATWKDQERSYLWRLSGFPFAFRAPKQLSCGFGPSVDDWEAGLTARDCESREPAQGGGPPPHDVRVELALRYCGHGCADEDRDALLRGARKSRSEEADWTRLGFGTSYAVREAGGAENRYEMLLWRHFTHEGDDGERAESLLWVSVDTPEEERQLAQKIVNDVFAQTGGKR
ncbi:AAA family ATPase [Streptomyces sp. JJ38]|uniref:NACHT domain-containing protein n=1 Tax=Streptomyces sp. JJ38 TaxID=2738128 RepID=UPI001C5A1B4D|nr:AAA family ATPase [Streptomyces sp. JJ38]MBW1600167.1 NACHT domain-containing protein [Streptomyces sp. JJ38]